MMATLSAKIFKHHKKADGTYNVKICVSHKNLRRYIDTERYVTNKKLSKDFSIKDTFINSCVNKALDDHRNMVSALGTRLNSFDVDQLTAHLLSKDQEIDLLKF